MEIVEKLLAGERLALSRAITAVENGRQEAGEIMRLAGPYCGNAMIVGITGAPGAGKSTLVDKMALAYRARGKTVGIIAVDPTSPFTGGAILGDRLRMASLYGDKGIFIRSMGTRGSLGGLSAKAIEAAKLMDAFGKDIVLIETVGVGQSETEIVERADVTVVVCVPGMGDDIQAIKAGIMEIADILVINKADRDGVDKIQRELQMLVELNHALGGKTIPICRTVATDDCGVAELNNSIDSFFSACKADGTLADRRKKRVRLELMEKIRERVAERVEIILESREMRSVLDEISDSNVDVFALCERIEKMILK